MQHSKQTLDAFDLINKSGLFDSKFYQKKYKKFLKNDEDPIYHYIYHGWKMGFAPSKKFSTQGYLNSYQDIRRAGINPLTHYICYGQAEGRHPNPPKRYQNLPFLRFSPEETGQPDIILPFDGVATENLNLENESICVHLHLFHMDMIEYMCYYLSHIEYEFSLLVSVTKDADTAKTHKILAERLPKASRIIVMAVANRGRDVLPWLVHFRQEIQKSTLFCHIHTKRSCDGWFRYLCHATLGSPSVVNKILNSFADLSIGIISPCYHWELAYQPNYGKNKKICKQLYKRLCGKSLPKDCPNYPAGSFFWARSHVLKPLFDLNLQVEDFPEEPIPVDGTLAHGIERIIGTLPALNGTRFLQATVDVAYDMIRYVDGSRKTITPAVTSAHYKSPKSQKSCDYPKIALFTALTGNYEEIMPLCAADIAVDRFVITDNNDIELPKNHTRIMANYIHPEAVRTARFAKTHPHLFFQDYDYVFWIDSNVHFIGDLYRYVDMLEQKRADCGFILHPVRDNFFQEAEELAVKNIAIAELINLQVTRYIQKKNILSEKLIESNFFICRPKSATVQKFLNLWWSEINRFTHRDQLSLNYAVVESKLKWINIMGKGYSTRDHADFIHFSHNFKGREKIIATIDTVREH